MSVLSKLYTIFWVSCYKHFTKPWRTSFVRIFNTVKRLVFHKKHRAQEFTYIMIHSTYSCQYRISPNCFCCIFTQMRYCKTMVKCTRSFLHKPF